MNKNFLFAFGLIVLLAAPASTLADSGPGPDTCLGSYTNEGNITNVTCKEISVDDIVSLDIPLQGDYVIGTHSLGHMRLLGKDIQDTTRNLNPIVSYFFPLSQKYSEAVSNLATSSIVFNYGGGDYSFGSAAYKDTTLIDKSFLVGKLSSMLKSNGISLSGNNIIASTSEINILNSNEILQSLKDQKASITLGDYLMREYKIGKTNESVSDEYGGTYSFATTDSVEWGKHIYAPKNQVIESQYVDVSTGNPLSDADLQISYTTGKHCDSDCIAAVPLTSPLKSVKNYWVYTKKGGKLALIWQKTEYGLDDGSTKVITNTDTNVSVTLLFGGSAGTPSISAPTNSSTTATSPVQSKGFFTRLLDLILSWFK